ncbi:hypothetical protein AB6888_10585 [Carnobacterium maltaromaticum]|uniref:hypothetical protein n=1 Tax=Carnobacterium maltaromaticum TaxID=2751 RepID=UPI0039BDD9AE
MKILVELNAREEEMLDDLNRWSKISSKKNELEYTEVPDSLSLRVALQSYYESYKDIGSWLDEWEKYRNNKNN